MGRDQSGVAVGGICQVCRPEAGGTLNHPCLTLLDQWVGGSDRFPGPPSGTRRPSRKWNKHEGPDVPSAPKQLPLAAFYPPAGAVGEGLAWARMSNKMAPSAWSYRRKMSLAMEI